MKESNTKLHIKQDHNKKFENEIMKHYTQKNKVDDTDL